MPPYLTISGIDVPVAQNDHAQRPNEQGGEKIRAHAGNLRSSIRWEKRGWDFSTSFMTEAEVAPLKAAVALGAYVTVSGDFIGGASVTCTVDIGESPYVPDNGGASFQRILNIGITEV